MATQYYFSTHWQSLNWLHPAIYICISMSCLCVQTLLAPFFQFLEQSKQHTDLHSPSPGVLYPFVSRKQYSTLSFCSQTIYNHKSVTV